MAWQKMATNTAGGTQDTLTATSFYVKIFNVILCHQFASGNVIAVLRVNGDSGNNYAARYSLDGGADSTVNTQAHITFAHTDNANDRLLVGYFFNLNAEEKLFVGFMTFRNTTGAANAPARMEVTGKWVTTGTQFGSVSVVNTSTGDLNTNTIISYLGSN